MAKKRRDPALIKQLQDSIAALDWEDREATAAALRAMLASLEPPRPHVVIVGTLGTGLHLYGPFDDAETAEAWAADVESAEPIPVLDPAEFAENEG